MAWYFNADFNEVQDATAETLARNVSEENGRLMAAAPELLAMLESLFNAANDLINYETDMQPKDTDPTSIYEHAERSLAEAGELLERLGVEISDEA